MVFFTVPSKLKFKKMHKLRLISEDNIYNNKGLCFGEYGVIATECSYITIKQVFAIRKFLLKK